MPKINESTNKFFWIYKVGFFIILALPILTIPPYFLPADWGKSIVFRSVLAIMLFLLVWQILYRKNEVSSLLIKNNKIIWALGGLFIAFLLASIFSVDPYFSFWGSPYRGGGFVTFAFYFVFAVLSFMVLKKEDWKKAWIFSIFIGILVSFVAIIQYYNLLSRIFITTNQPASTVGNPIILAIYLLLLSFPTLSFAIKEEKKPFKIFYIASLIIFIFAILISGTRAVYLGIVVGVLYFLLFYPKKLKILKICLGLFLILIVSAVIYANIHPQLPNILQNRIIKGVVSQLSIKKALNDERFKAWQIVLKEVEDKPVLGWGPENLAVGFDKNYSPLIVSTPWWDKAHNIFLDTGAEAGVLGTLAYVLLFVSLFWQLQKSKNQTEDENKKVVITGIQATLIGYLFANFFSFDSSTTYLIFFLIIGYSMHLIYSESKHNEIQEINQKNTFWKSACIGVLFIILIIFLWQYNLLPLQINAQINESIVLVSQKQCDQAFTAMDKILPEHSFLDSYIRLEYVDFERTCSAFYPENNLAYTQKGVELLDEAVKIQPLYTRYWIFLGNLTTTLAEQASDSATRNSLLLQADNYLNKALQLSAKHQEIFTAKAKIQIDDDNYKNAEDISKECVNLNPALGDCYWYLGLSEIYLKDSTDANKNIQTAVSDKYNDNSLSSLVELGNAYNHISDYQNLATVFEKLVASSPDSVQYHSSLAAIYAKIGEYDKARQEAATVLRLSPESKENVDTFLKTLP